MSGGSILICALLAAEGLSQECGSIDFADELLREGDYYRAVTEYKRFVFFNPDSPEADEARLGIGRSLYFAGQFGLLQQWLIALPDSSPIFDEATLITARGALDASIPQAAISVLEGSGPMDSSRFYEFAFLRGIAYARNGDYDLARERFGQVFPGTDLRPAADRYIDILGDPPGETPRNPTIAAIMGVIPGLGYAYSGHYGTALASLAVNGLLAWGTYSAFDDDNDEAGYALAVLGFGFYSGNIYGSAQSAERYNEYVHDQFRSSFTY